MDSGLRPNDAKVGFFRNPGALLRPESVVVTMLLRSDLAD